MADKKRLSFISEQIRTEKKISVKDLGRMCHVTEETIRRDLDKLEADGVVTRIHGGAIWNEASINEKLSFYKRFAKNQTEKQLIAKKLFPILEGKNTIIADSSTTVWNSLRLLADSATITVVTNSTEVFREFQQSAINIISTGGEFNKNSLSLTGQSARTAVKNYNTDIALISCKGLNMNGVFDSNENEAEIKKAMISQAKEIALLADHSKFDQIALVKLIDLDILKFIVTDTKPTDEWVSYCAEHGITLIY